MRKKHRRSLLTMAVAYLFLGSIAGSPQLFAAASGNYTDLLPIGAAGNTTVISNGSGWSLTTTAPSATFGDAISRAPYTAFQTYVSSTISNTALVSTFTALVGGTSVGSATVPASWVALGRSIRITTKGYYSTTGAPNFTWAVLMTTTSIVTTGAVGALAGLTNVPFSATALLTVSTTSTAAHGWAMNGSYEIISGSAAIATGNLISYSTFTTSAVNVDLTSQLIIRPVFTWGTASTSNKLTVNNCIIEFLN